MGLCFTCIPQGSIGVLESCSKYSGELEPGCHFLIPLVHQVAYTFNMRQCNIRVAVDTKTQDNVYCKVLVDIFYIRMLNKIYEVAYNINDLSQTITSIVQDVVRTVLAKMTLDEAFVSKDELSGVVKNKLSMEIGNHGIEIRNVLISDVEPDRKVREAMNEINTQQRLKVAKIEQAEGDKIALIKNAEGEAEVKRLSGLGVAAERQEIVRGLEGSICSFVSAVQGVDNSQIMEMLLTTQYFDTLRAIGANSKSNCVYVPLQLQNSNDNKLFLSNQLRER